MIDTAEKELPSRPALKDDPQADLMEALSPLALAWQVLYVFDTPNPPTFRNGALTEPGVWMKSHAARIVEEAATDLEAVVKAQATTDDISELLYRAKRILRFIADALTHHQRGESDYENVELFADAAFTVEELIKEIEAAHRSLDKESPTPNPNQGGTP